MSRSTSALPDGVILNNRYRIIRQIGRGGFGRAYLAEDTQRYRELCVLKEFAPQVESDRQLCQAEDLFEREAGILYQLNHQQIPQFEALLKTQIDGRRSLFLVQEYVEGESYWELLKYQGRLTETEVTKMIREVLPVLEYIHDADLIHRDISPDNLIRRELDDKTVLIDFGCVKIAANAVSKSRGKGVTLIGKKGYSPDEQLNRGQAYRSSDLYSLAVTAIVLLTGKQPDELYDSQLGQWDWSQAKVSPRLTKILTKMLQERPGDRYQSADQISQILAKDDDFTFRSLITRCRTLIVAPGNNFLSSNRFWSQLPYPPRFCFNPSDTWRKITQTTTNFSRVRPWQWGMITAAIIVIPGLISFTLTQSKIAPTTDLVLDGDNNNFSLSQSEQRLQQDIYQKLKSLNLDAGAFYTQVDRTFYRQHPELVGVQLSQTREHQAYREIWYQIAVSLLKQQSKNTKPANHSRHD